MSRVRTFAAVTVVVLELVLVTASPAAAHDELLASSPGDGEQLAVAPETVSLTFSADVLTMGAAIIVVDQSGRDWVTEEPVVAEATVTAILDAGMPEAGYEVRWRVVSSDGHPISGVIPFTIGDADPLTRTPPPNSGGSDETDEQSQNTQEEDQGALRVVLIGAGGAAAAVGVLALISFLRRRKPAPAQPGGSDTPDH